MITPAGRLAAHAVAVSIAVAAVALGGCAPRGARTLEELEGSLERLRMRWDVPGLSAAMARDGEVVWEKAFGLADVEARRPVEPGTVFHLCSLTKPLSV